MGRVARRLNHDAGEQIGADLWEQQLHRVGDARGEKGENVHDVLGSRQWSRG